MERARDEETASISTEKRQSPRNVCNKYSVITTLMSTMSTAISFLHLSTHLYYKNCQGGQNLYPALGNTEERPSLN